MGSQISQLNGYPRRAGTRAGKFLTDWYHRHVGNRAELLRKLACLSTRRWAGLMAAWALWLNWRRSLQVYYP